ncbi:hypothetical protein T492DRAFT_1131109 [Pavlovales sp. CCMP2436]|nr:hypothetical protein T492DRAFT_1131109 [Pavlovales sp. CCMP2436]
MAMKACRSSRASGLALFALVLCSTARPTTHDEAIDVDELLRRVGDLEGGELNLEELLRQAGSGEGARADGSDAAAETSRRAPSYDDDDPDLAEYEPPVRAAGRFRGGFGGNDDDEPEDPRAATDQDDGGAEGGGTFGLRIDKATLSVLRRWTNFANGVLLILLGPITLAISAGSLQFDKMILSVYVS